MSTTIGTIKLPGPGGRMMDYDRASVRPKGWRLLRAIHDEQMRDRIALTPLSEDE